jgi:hypothetical protein
MSVFYTMILVALYGMSSVGFVLVAFEENIGFYCFPFFIVGCVCDVLFHNHIRERRPTWPAHLMEVIGSCMFLASFGFLVMAGLNQSLRWAVIAGSAVGISLCIWRIRSAIYHKTWLRLQEDPPKKKKEESQSPVTTMSAQEFHDRHGYDPPEN